MASGVPPGPPGAPPGAPPQGDLGSGDLGSDCPETVGEPRQGLRLAGLEAGGLGGGEGEGVEGEGVEDPPGLRPLLPPAWLQACCFELVSDRPETVGEPRPASASRGARAGGLGGRGG